MSRIIQSKLRNTGGAIGWLLSEPPPRFGGGVYDEEPAMLGRVQDWRLTVDKILDHAKTWHGAREIVTRSVEGAIVTIPTGSPMTAAFIP